MTSLNTESKLSKSERCFSSAGVTILFHKATHRVLNRYRSGRFFLLLFLLIALHCCETDTWGFIHNNSTDSSRTDSLSNAGACGISSGDIFYSTADVSWTTVYIQSPLEVSWSLFNLLYITVSVRLVGPRKGQYHQWNEKKNIYKKIEAQQIAGSGAVRSMDWFHSRLVLGEDWWRACRGGVHLPAGLHIKVWVAGRLQVASRLRTESITGLHREGRMKWIGWVCGYQGDISRIWSITVQSTTENQSVKAIRTQNQFIICPEVFFFVFLYYLTGAEAWRGLGLDLF